MGDRMNGEKIEMKINEFLPILRGCLIKHYNTNSQIKKSLILYSFTSQEARDFASNEPSSLRNSPVESQNAGNPPLNINLMENYESIEKVKLETNMKIKDFINRNKRVPDIITVAGCGIIQVIIRENMKDKVALVTGAAGAIGSGICKELLEQGYNIAVTDLPGENLDSVFEEFEKEAEERVVKSPLDVTSEKSVIAGFNKVIKNWGGVDIVIANAGIPLVDSLLDMDLEDFKKLERVNIEGTLLTIREAGKKMILQNVGGDIVLISTKNVFSPGARFGAYSATKAAAHQLARIASLEYAEYDIRVNMVAPDAVFSSDISESGLWKQVGPDRMEDKGIHEIKDLESYYRNRNLLKEKITAKDVAKGVMFFVERMTPTTGVTLPVDGGLPDATPR